MDVEPAWKNEDVVSVRKLYALFDTIINRTNGQLQIIVLDHANEEVWCKLPNVLLVEEWEGKGLASTILHSSLAIDSNQ